MKIDSNQEALETFIAEAQLREAERTADLVPWERLGIEWSDYHPKAREILNDPFFWDSMDDYAPHGNDTGADLLHDFLLWRKTHLTVDVAHFLQRLLEEWGFNKRRLARLRKPVSTWTEADEIMLCLYDEATVAAAFAQLKLEAKCDAKVREAALASIARQLDPTVATHFGWSIPEERIQRLELIRRILLVATS